MNDPPFRRRQRRMSDAERALWSEVTRDVAPLRRAAVAPFASEPAAAKPQREPVAAGKEAPAAPAPPAVAVRPAAPPLAPLGRRMRSRIARGSHALGGRLDLHGLTQREAYDALLGFLRIAQEREAGLVLVITGKGASPASSASERGVLRRQVPQWLRLPGFRELIVGFEDAHLAHGGEGALYVRVRRRRESGNRT
jgi:DNA-nicking Smr family endonuclease